jgi:RimJ/RimL family protein N-acetyltransferase
MSVELRPAKHSELALFRDMESDEASRQFVGQNSLEVHEKQFADSRTIYLTILCDDQPAGFFLLILEEDDRSIDFKRIVVAEKNNGIGQVAITLMEDFCRLQLALTRVWLNVFEFNHRGIHVYEKLGYRYFKSTELDGKVLLYYEKDL